MKTRQSVLIILALLLPALHACMVPPRPEANPQEILVKYKEEARPTQVNALEARIGLQETKEIAKLNIKVYKVTSPKTIDEAIRECERESFVVYAEPNLEHKTQE